MEWIEFEEFMIRVDKEEYRVNFWILEIAGRGQNPATLEFDMPLYGEELSPSKDGIEPFWNGTIKWDGCSDWDFRTNECMAHFCGKKNALSIGRLMEKCYEIAATIPSWDTKLAS